MPELILALLLFVALGGLAWSLGGGRVSPSTLWIWGWMILFATAVFVDQAASLPWSSHVAHATGPMFPALLLAGALRYARGVFPKWLLPAAAALGGLRWIAAAGGSSVASHALALTTEPTAELVAAYLVFQASRDAGLPLAQQLLAPAFVAVAGVDGASAVAGVLGHELYEPVMWAWVVVALPTLLIQITAASQRSRSLRRQLLRDGQRAREALRSSEERFRLLAERATDLIYEIDAQGRFTYASPSFAETLGYAPEALLGRDGFDLVHPDDREAGRGRLLEAVEREGPSDVVLRGRHRDGSWRWLEANIRAFRTASGELRVMGVSRDVTERREVDQSLREAHDALEQRVEDRTAQLLGAIAELEREVAARRRAERDLRASQERYRVISELSSDLSFAFRVAPDRSLSPEWVTQAVLPLTGYTRSELEQRGLRSIVHPDDWSGVVAHVRDALAGNAGEFETRLVTKGGETRWFHSRIAAVRSDADGQLRIVGATRDVTERKQAEEERRRLEAHFREVQRLESLGVLAGGIAHDFNNLLSVILGQSSLALTDLGPESELAKRFARIRSAAQLAAGLTEQMLTYSGKTAFTLKPLDLSKLVDGMAELLEASISKKCTLSLEIERGLPPMEGDETQLRQVVVNLVTNAAEALGEEGGRVTVRSGSLVAGPEDLARCVGAPDPPPGEYVFLEVEDSGPGMDESTQERIFEPFYTTKRSGRGLGLAAVLGIVQGHHGVVRLTSGPERGTTFRALFPTGERAGEGRGETASRAEARRDAGTRAAHPRGSATVLIIDDEEAVLEVGAEFLRRSGYDVLTASGGREGVDLFQRRAAEIDAVVLDLVMPDVDGEETLRQIHRARPDVPVILTSGYDEERTAERFGEGRVAGFIGKPYEPDDLVGKLRAALDR